MMCGRFTITVSIDELKDYLSEYYNIDELNSDLIVPKYNVAPGQDVISVINDGNQNRVGLFKWGFVPSFAKDEKIGNRMINAKSETLEEKPSYKPSIKHKRCVILANGFYEWKENNQVKIPMRIVMKDESIFPMAGLWSTYMKPDGTKLHSCTIITTQANRLVSSIHERMPVILTEEARKIWLNSKITDYSSLAPLLKPFDSELMALYQVSSLVNLASNDFIEVIKAI